jgi:hypothetical protein
MTSQSWSTLAIPCVLAIIVFLGYSSQFLFSRIEPHPLESRETIRFNILLVCLLISYGRACWTDPGTARAEAGVNEEEAQHLSHPNSASTPKRRWCRKCEAVKPPRAHHCRSCKRYEFKFFFLLNHAQGKRLIRSLDAFQKWTITAHGQLIASHIEHCRTSFAFCSSLSWR